MCHFDPVVSAGALRSCIQTQPRGRMQSCVLLKCAYRGVSSGAHQSVRHEQKKKSSINCSHQGTDFQLTEPNRTDWEEEKKMMRSMFCLLLLLKTGHAWVASNFLMTGPKAYLPYASSVQVGTQTGAAECKHQFSWDRWNCPDSAMQLRGLRRATRETSFVHAISAAGVMFTLTRNCSLGDLQNCGCDQSNHGKTGGRGWLWGGCSDNVDFGERISKLYVDALETGQDSRAAVNLHNNAAGRHAVKATMKRICRCHGMSESCSIQTCWMQLSSFREIGDFLKIKYNHSQKLNIDRKRQRAGNSADSRGGAIVDTFSSVAQTELIYLEKSPDYCRRNGSLGLHGTEGRECLKHADSLTQWERRSCRRLCHDCGLNVEKKRVEVVSSCNCKFHWCCKVNCEDCVHVRVKHVCARREGGDGPAFRR